jgi:hypothetical protein
VGCGWTQGLEIMPRREAVWILGQDLLYLSHHRPCRTLVGSVLDLRQMYMEFMDKIEVTEVVSKLEKGQKPTDEL